MHKQTSHTKYDIKQKGKAENLWFPGYMQTADRNFRKKSSPFLQFFISTDFSDLKIRLQVSERPNRVEKKVHLERKPPPSMCGLKRHKGSILSGQKASLALNILEIFIQHNASRVAHIQLEREYEPATLSL